MIKNAMLLSAGLGTRMQPLTDNCPKPLLLIGGRPQIDYVVESLKQSGVKNFVVNACYLSEQVCEHFDSQQDITVITESVRLETGGGVKNAIDLLDDTFFVANTDSILTDIGQSLFTMQNMFDGSMGGLLLLVPKNKAVGYQGNGDFSLNTDGTLVRNPIGEYIFSGLQILTKNAFDNASTGSFSLNVVYDNLLATGRLKGCVHLGDWYHISTPSDVDKINELFKAGSL